MVEAAPNSHLIVGEFLGIKMLRRNNCSSAVVHSLDVC